MFTLDHINALIIRHNQFLFLKRYKETQIRQKKKVNDENIQKEE